VSLSPAARDIGEHGQNRKLVVVVPKEERVVPEQNHAAGDHDYAGCKGAEKF
jgi:hypothetical protein